MQLHVEVWWVGCQREVKYGEFTLEQLIRGLADKEILSELLGDPKMDRTMQETVEFIAQKEQAKSEQEKVSYGSSATSAVNSTPSTRTSTSSTRSTANCWACFEPMHGSSTRNVNHKEKFPAWSATCSKCDMKSHFTKACSKCIDCGVTDQKRAKSVKREK